MCIDNFNDDYLQPLLAKLSSQNKQVILAGDFNINLLNYESNTQTTNFLNDITSNLFVPHITVPYGNIFSNFTEFTSFISVNFSSQGKIINTHDWPKRRTLEVQGPQSDVMSMTKHI